MRRRACVSGMSKVENKDSKLSQGREHESSLRLHTPAVVSPWAVYCRLAVARCFKSNDSGKGMAKT